MASVKDGPSSLSGGNLTELVRIGDAVHRSTGPWSGAVHALLTHLEQAGFDGAPRYLGMDSLNREVLEYIPGECPWNAEARKSLVALESVARLLRRFHDAVQSFTSPVDAAWQGGRVARPGDVICHNDVSPFNTVFEGERAVAFIDWDLAGPSRPITDVAYACWWFVPLYRDEPARTVGWESPPPRAVRLAAFCDAYGLPDDLRATLIGEVVACQVAAAATIQERGEAWEPGWRELLESGHHNEVLADADFARGNSTEWTAAILDGTAPDHVQSTTDR